ncbi:GGDEF domain-containing protein [Clostridium sp. ATCC 25772]|uniref:GGDEF domain-containing protein n=1 Tax=Clostridium sp. ATCC 25772 TaxID=1676991 RepID=UPI000781EFB1|nr:GGDEF domain-containing protein [Clostridium sp. ATCC 25772]
MKFRRLKVFFISFLLVIFLKKINVIAMENVENFIDQIGKTNNYDVAKMIDYCEKMLDEKSTKKNDKLQAKIYFSLVYLNRLELNYDDALKYVDIAKYYLIQEKYYEELVDLYGMASNMTSAKEEFKMSSYYAYESLEVLNKIQLKDKREKYKEDRVAVNYLMATLIQQLNAPEHAKEYYNVGQELEKENKIDRYDIYTSLAFYNYYNKNFQEAEKYFAKAYDKYLELKNEYDVDFRNQLLLNLVYSQIELKKFDEAEKNLKIIENSLNDSIDLIEVGKINNAYGNLYYNKSDYDKALNYYYKAYNNLKEKSVLKMSKDIVNRLIKIYEIKGEKEQELYWRRNGELLDENSNDNENGIVIEIIEKIHKDKYREINNNKKFIYNLQVGLIFFILTTIILILTLLISVLYSRNKKREKVNLILKEKINKDPLTGAYNREYFNNIVSTYDENKKQCIIAILDIDDYKKINDSYGHLFGDYILIELVKVIKKILNKKDILVRYGGEEFLIIVEKKNLMDISPLEKIRKEIEEYSWKENVEITVTIGAAKYDGKKSVTDTILLADELLYKGKNSGKNVVIYEK